MTETINVEALEVAIVQFGLREFVEILQESDWSAIVKDVVTLPNIGAATFVEGDFAEEGGGDSAWVVFSINDELFRINGSYSYNGPTWENSTIESVKPQEITQIIYVANEN